MSGIRMEIIVQCMALFRRIHAIKKCLQPVSIVRQRCNPRPLPRGKLRLGTANASAKTEGGELPSESHCGGGTNSLTVMETEQAGTEPLWDHKSKYMIISSNMNNLSPNMGL